METSFNIYQYNQFYKENKKALQNFIFKMTHDAMTAEELVNDVFVKVYQNMQKFDATKSSLRTWVFNIATNATIDFLRKKKLATKSMDDVFQDSEGNSESMDFASEDSDPLAQMIANESQAQIAAAIKNLSASQAEIITQYAQGFTYEDIAAELNIPIGTVKGSMHIARNRMREFFKRPKVAIAA